MAKTLIDSLNYAPLKGQKFRNIQQRSNCEFATKGTIYKVLRVINGLSEPEIEVQYEFDGSRAFMKLRYARDDLWIQEITQNQSQSQESQLAEKTSSSEGSGYVDIDNPD